MKHIDTSDTARQRAAFELDNALMEWFRKIRLCGDRPLEAYEKRLVDAFQDWRSNNPLKPARGNRPKPVSPSP